MTTNTAGSETVSAVLRALRERLEIAEDFPDDVLVLPWNLRDEITAQLAETLQPGTRLIWPMPDLDIETLGAR